MNRFTWKHINKLKIIKELDYSSFTYNGSVIPQQFYEFFNIGSEDKDIILKKNNKQYQASLKWTKEGTRESSPVIRVWWDKNLSNDLKQKFPDWIKRKQGDKLSHMKLIFEKTDDSDSFSIDIYEDHKSKIILTNKKRTYGHIEGIKVGQIFSDRKEVKDAGLHIHRDAGIDGTAKEATCAIVLSGGYEDDVDELDYILYTGQGGQNTRRGENITKQIKDQEFTRGNQGLVLSKEYNKPVRVIRGYQTTHGPQKGYRYDGLYYVVDYERVKGKSGFYVCRFHLLSELTVDNLELKLKKSLKPNYERTSRTEVTTSRIKRNTSISENLKEIYEYKCQICDIFLNQPGTERGICIGAHIKPIGKPHEGPDAIENMLCLCPNHHDQFDKHSFTIDSQNMKIIGLEGYTGKQLNVNKKHRIDKDFVDYHKKQYEIKNN